jgi:hypothetical protein
MLTSDRTTEKAKATGSGRNSTPAVVVWQHSSAPPQECEYDGLAPCLLLGGGHRVYVRSIDTIDCDKLISHAFLAP